MHSGTPMNERSDTGTILISIVLPIPTGIAILFALVVNVATQGHSFTALDRLGQVVWFGLLGLGVMTCLPDAGWQELQKRKTMREAKGKQEQVEGVKKPAPDGLDDMMF